jgi:hypothetical protein
MAEDVASAVRQDRLVPNHFDVARAMVTARRGRRDAWEFLRRFTEQWATRLDELSGCGDQELTAAEHRLGLTLPAALREGYALLGRRDDLTSNQDVLLRPDQLYFDETGRALIFRVENQSVAHWGIRRGRCRASGTPLHPAGDAGLPDVGRPSGAADPLVLRP